MPNHASRCRHHRCDMPGMAITLIGDQPAIIGIDGVADPTASVCYICSGLAWAQQAQSLRRGHPEGGSARAKHLPYREPGPR